MTVRTARGGELERGLGFGIVRQLLESALVEAVAAERDRLLAGAARLAEPVFTDVSTAEETGEVAFATLHGLYWLVVNLAERGPLSLPSTTHSGPTNRRYDSCSTSHIGSRGCRSCWRWPCERAPTGTARTWAR